MPLTYACAQARIFCRCGNLASFWAAPLQKLLGSIQQKQIYGSITTAILSKTANSCRKTHQHLDHPPNVNNGQGNTSQANWKHAIPGDDGAMAALQVNSSVSLRFSCLHLLPTNIFFLFDTVFESTLRRMSLRIPWSTHRTRKTTHGQKRANVPSYEP